MTPKPTGRTQECGKDQARVRLTQGQSFLEVAELVIDDEGELETAGVAAALAVLAGIAAADAACCFALGVRSRGQDHRQAVQLVAQVGPDGRSSPTPSAGRLLDVKDGAHYGLVFVGAQPPAVRSGTPEC
jgi:hypothetical protein